MRYLELLVTDVPDDAAPVSRTEWIHRDHIETIEAYLTGESDPQTLWLELTLTSGRLRYLPIRPVSAGEAQTAARAAVTALLEHGGWPLAVVALDEDHDRH